jgi:hypothetical protein
MSLSLDTSEASQAARLTFAQRARCAAAILRRADAASFVWQPSNSLFGTTILSWDATALSLRLANILHVYVGAKTMKKLLAILFVAVAGVLNVVQSHCRPT